MIMNYLMRTRARNLGASAVNFVSNLWSGTEYETKVNNEVAAYMKQNGYECKKIEPKAE